MSLDLCASGQLHDASRLIRPRLQCLCLSSKLYSVPWFFQSTELRSITPPGYKCLDAARPIPPDANVDTLHYQNHGGLAFIYRHHLKLKKMTIDTTVKTFEFLCDFASTASCHFVLLGVYRPGSQALSTVFLTICRRCLNSWRRISVQT